MHFAVSIVTRSGVMIEITTLPWCLMWILGFSQTLDLAMSLLWLTPWVKCITTSMISWPCLPTWVDRQTFSKLLFFCQIWRLNLSFHVKIPQKFKNLQNPSILGVFTWNSTKKDKIVNSEQIKQNRLNKVHKWRNKPNFDKLWA